MVQFNRTPLLITNVARLVLCLIQAHYYDDADTVELRCLAPASKVVVCRLFQYFGALLNHQKRQFMNASTKFLGQFSVFLRAWQDGAIVLQPSPVTKAKAIDMIHMALTSGQLSSGDAAKLKGLLTWLDTALRGRPCRGALGVLSVCLCYDFALHLGPLP